MEAALSKRIMHKVDHLASPSRRRSLRRDHLLKHLLLLCAATRSLLRADEASSPQTASNRHRAASSDRTSLPRCSFCGTLPPRRLPKCKRYLLLSKLRLLLLHRALPLRGGAPIDPRRNQIGAAI